MTNDPRTAFDEIVDDVAGRAKRGQMMGYPTITVDRKLAACLDGDLLGIRLGRETPAFATAIALPGATVFRLGNGPRQFTDWVALPLSQSAHWLPNVLLAIERLELANASSTEGAP